MTEKTDISPLDEFNQILLANVRPSDWINPRSSGKYHLVVIGGGTAGLVTAAGAAGLGASVALIERDMMGGDCLNVGCVPSKSLIRAARAAAELRKASEFGVQITGDIQVDFSEVMSRVRRLRSAISPHDSFARFRSLGVDVYQGSGSFISPTAIEVSGQSLLFKNAVIATGARAVRPQIPGLCEAGFLTNENVFNLTSLPNRLAVIGAGPIGCEMAQCFARFGSQVTLIEQSAQILPREDSQASAILEQALRRDGIQIRKSARVVAAGQHQSGKYLRISMDAIEDELVVDDILIGLGRTPNVEGLNLEAARVQYDSKSGVAVNDRLQTTNPRVFAAGDICSTDKFTHAADFQARIVIRNALFWGSDRASALLIPRCVYTSPEIAQVGLSEPAANAQGIPVDIFRQSFDEVDRAVLDGENEGFVKILVRKGTDRILGATVVADHAGDLISEISVAMHGRLGLKRLASVIHPYPTQAEAIRKLGDAYNKTRLTPFIKALFQRWLAWTR